MRKKAIKNPIKNIRRAQPKLKYNIEVKRKGDKQWYVTDFARTLKEAKENIDTLPKGGNTYRITDGSGKVRNTAMKKSNVSMGYYDSYGFHPIRASHDYDEDRVDEHFSKKRPVRAYARKEKAFKRKNPHIKESDFTRITNDVNGNPRYVLHFLKVGSTYEQALKKARKVGGKKFHNKQYGGGIVFQSYSLSELIKHLHKVQNVSMGYYDSYGFHPIRASHDYDEDRVDEHYSKRRPVRAYARKEKVFKSSRRNSAKRSNGKPFNSDRLDELSEMFQGKVTGNTIKTIGSDLTPDLTARLGKAVLMIIKNGKHKYQIDFDAKDAYLSMDARKNLYLEGRGAIVKNLGKPNKGALTYLGEVQQIDYITDKAHIENGDTVHYYHKLGEVDGKKPNAYLDSDGFPIIIGGNYDILPEGIAN